jgi:O-acetylhomoserine/O-acetylserine sulfhydrylase-like pyridoxal-dependent enzyme
MLPRSPGRRTKNNHATPPNRLETVQLQTGQSGSMPKLIRVSIGIEHADTIPADFDTAR